MSRSYGRGRNMNHYRQQSDSDDTNQNESWTPENDEDSSDDKNYSSDPEEMQIKRPRRIRKKGRKAKFNVEQMLFDQQMMATNPNLIQQNQAMMMAYQAQQTQYLYNYNPQQQFPQQINQQLTSQTLQMEAPQHHNMVHTQVLDESSFFQQPNLETIQPGYIPRAFDIVPRGNRFGSHPR